MRMDTNDVVCSGRMNFFFICLINHWMNEWNKPNQTKPETDLTTTANERT